MGKVSLTFEIDDELKAAFSAAAKAEGRAMDDVLSDVIQGYLQAQTEDKAYDEWLADKVREAFDDPRPNVPHAEVMARMDAEIAGLKRGV